MNTSQTPVYSVSVIIPCYNEQGNIAQCIQRTPSIGVATEIIVIDDGSQDETVECVKKIMKVDHRVRLIAYMPNKGKAYAVKKGIENASHELIMILDADMTVEPEMLDEFYRFFITNNVDLLIGTRFKQTFSKRAMPVIKQVSNKVSAWFFSRILHTHITDTLCGTKVLRTEDARQVELEKCRWGDFDFLRHAALHNMIVKELPVSYKERRSGKSSMTLFPDGVGLYKRAIEIFIEVCRERTKRKKHQA